MKEYRGREGEGRGRERSGAVQMWKSGSEGTSLAVRRTAVYPSALRGQAARHLPRAAASPSEKSTG